MHAPKRPWSAPPHEDIPPISRIRSIPTWQEPPQEDRLTTTSRPFRLLSAKPKSKLVIKYNSTETTRSFKYQFESCSFPRFKKLRILKPDQSHEKVVALRKKNNDTWVSILSHLHRYSCLYQKTADSRYQEEHISNVLTNYNQISTARHLQVWQHFAEWCEPFGFHPAINTTSFLLDFIYEVTHQIQ